MMTTVTYNSCHKYFSDTLYNVQEDGNGCVDSKHGCISVNWFGQGSEWTVWFSFCYQGYCYRRTMDRKTLTRMGLIRMARKYAMEIANDTP